MQIEWVNSEVILVPGEQWADVSHVHHHHHHHHLISSAMCATLTLIPLLSLQKWKGQEEHKTDWQMRWRAFPYSHGCQRPYSGANSGKKTSNSALASPTIPSEFPSPHQIVKQTYVYKFLTVFQCNLYFLVKNGKRGRASGKGKWKGAFSKVHSGGKIESGKGK